MFIVIHLKIMKKMSLTIAPTGRLNGALFRLKISVKSKILCQFTGYNVWITDVLQRQPVRKRKACTISDMVLRLVTYVYITLNIHKVFVRIVSTNSSSTGVVNKT